MNKSLEIKKIIIVVLCIIVIISALGCKNIDKDYVDNVKTEEYKKYVLNENSKKIHIEKCVSAQKISDKNRRVVDEKLSKLIKSGYTICHNCKAGLKKLDVMQGFKDAILHRNLQVELPNYLMNYEDYLKAIEKMGRWYVTNIPTFCTKLEEELLYDYDGYEKYIKEYELRNKYKNQKESLKKFNIISRDSEGLFIDNLDKNLKILKANAIAISNYQNNYYGIKFTNSLALYPCELLEKSADDYKKAGDDSVRFLMSVWNYIDGELTSAFRKYSKMKWSNLKNSILFYDRADIAYAVTKLGFEIYDINGENVDINGDGLVDFEIDELTKDFKLERGDILLSKDCLAFYLGENDRSGYEIFGWNEVNRTYPSILDVKIIEQDEKNMIRITNAKSNKNRFYSRIFRFAKRG